MNIKLKIYTHNLEHVLDRLNEYVKDTGPTQLNVEIEFMDKFFDQMRVDEANSVDAPWHSNMLDQLLNQQPVATEVTNDTLRKYTKGGK